MRAYAPICTGRTDVALDRVLATVLFTDIVASTEQLAVAGDDASRHVRCSVSLSRRPTAWRRSTTPAIWATRVAAQAGDLMLVGHLPHLAKLAGLLLAGDSDRPVIAFRQGGLVSLEDGPARWSVWLIVPPAAV